MQGWILAATPYSLGKQRNYCRLNDKGISERGRELRDLTRHRSQLVAEQTRVGNRIQKTLEDANVKLAPVATDSRFT